MASLASAGCGAALYAARLEHHPLGVESAGPAGLPGKKKKEIGREVEVGRSVATSSRLARVTE